MKKFEGVMLCTDIDGTLTNDKNNVSEENIEAIRYFTQHGGIFTIATGRIPFTIPIVLNEFIKIPVVCQNGSAIYDVNKKEYVSYKSIDRRAIEITKEISQKFPFSGIEFYRLYDIAFVKENNATSRHHKLENISCVTHLDCNIEDVKGPIIKILFAQEENETERMYTELENSVYQSEYKLLKSHKWYYEILRKDVNKGNALKELCGILNVDLKNVITAGDNDNDIELIQASGLSYATQNATENLKKVADRITKSNNDHAIADIIYRI